MRNSYRKVALSAIAAAAVLSCMFVPETAVAQLRRGYKSEKKSPRAVGALVVRGKKAYLYPVCLFFEGKMLDAGLYRSTPVPMALWSDTLYDVLRDGMPAGTFTVASALRNNSEGYTGIGSWKPFASGDDSTQSAKKDDKAKPSASDDPDRPVFRRPKADAPSTQPANPAPAAADGQLGREVVPPEPSADPNAPVLRRGSAETPAAKSNESRSKQVEDLSPMSPGEWYAAVSDPDPYTNRPLQYSWSDDRERVRMMNAAQQLALGQFRKVAQQRRLLLPKNVSLSDINVRAFDLDYSNSPQLIITARYSGPSLLPSSSGPSLKSSYIQITVVARADFNGDLTPLFTAVSNPRDLDDAPEYQFIDAIDADGDSRAELLFRRQLDGSTQWVLYRVLGLSMSEFFATARR